MRDVCRAVVRHRWKALLVFLVVTVAVGLATTLTPNTYRSEGKLLVDMAPQAPVEVTPEASQRSHFTGAPPAREQEIQSVVETLNGRQVIEQLVDAIGVRAILDPGKAPKGSTHSDELCSALRQARAGADALGQAAKRWIRQLRTSSTGPLDARDRAIAEVARGLDIRSVGGSGVIEICYRGRSPDTSWQIVSRLMGFSRQRHVSGGQPDRPPDVLAEKLARASHELAGEREQLQALWDETGQAGLNRQHEGPFDRIVRLEDDLRREEVACAVSEMEVRRLREEVASLAEMEARPQGLDAGVQVSDHLLQQLEALEFAEQVAAVKYTDAHPKMQLIRRQVAAAQAAVARNATYHYPTNRLPRAQQVLAREEEMLRSLQAKAGSLRTELAVARDELKDLGQSELRLAMLQREVELCEASYRRYAARFEQPQAGQPRIAAVTSRLRLIQDATYEPEPLRPRMLLHLGLGMLAGALGGIGLALVTELRDHRFRTPEDVERNLQLPVLMSIPRLRRKDALLTEQTEWQITRAPDPAVLISRGLNRRFDEKERQRYRTVLGRMDWPAGDSSSALRTLGVTSCHHGEGVSAVAARLAVTAASYGNYRILLVDANVARPSAHHTFGVELAPGLADFSLLVDEPFGGALQSSRIANLFKLHDDQLVAAIQETRVMNLSLLAAGRPHGDPAEVFHSADLIDVVRIVRDRFDLVVFDLPATAQMTSAIRLAGLLDAVLLVVEAQRVRREVARHTTRELVQANTYPIGAVLNKRREYLPPWLYNTS